MQVQYDSNLKRLMLLMNQAFEDCTRQVDPLSTERLAELVYQVMSARYRIFHTVEHIFAASEDMEGPGVFAALFHDVVYHQVDRRIHPLLVKHLSEFSINEQTSECVLPDIKSERLLSIASNIFGFKTGQSLNPFTGLNEFLSAVCAARILSPILSEWQCIQIITCIEATIPFRSQQDSKTNSFNQLRQRLGEVNQEFQLKATVAQLDETIKMSITLANGDIASFYSTDLGEFVSGTWNLILENNPIFKNPLYTVVDYRKALQKVRGFFSILKHDHVVHEWGGVPAENDFADMKQQVASNLSNAILYLDINLVAVSIFEVIALATGGDAPYFLMTGESLDGSDKAPIERFFKDTNFRSNLNMNEVVYYILKQGRKATSSFDFNHSPVGAYLYENLTAEEVTQAITNVQELHAGKMDGAKYLSSFRAEIIEPITKGVAEISWSRKV